MKVAISITGSQLDSPFDARFGRVGNFCLVDSESGEWSAHDNVAVSASGGAGVLAAQFIAGLGAQAVISGAYGPKAYDTLSPAGIKMFLGPTEESLTARQVLGLFNEGKLAEANGSTHAGYHGGNH